PRLVSPERIAAANAIRQGSAQLVGTVGPAMAGIAVAAVGAGAAFALDAASFAIAAVALWLVRSGAVPGRPDDEAVRSRMAEAVVEPDAVARPSLAASLV